MIRLRFVALAALAIALCAPPIAAANESHNGAGQLVPPTHRFGGLSGGEFLGLAWSYSIRIPLPENPSFGDGEPCVTFGRMDKILMAYGGGARCTVEHGTTVFVNGFSGFCTNADEPPYFGVDEAAQRKCVLRYLPPLVESLRVTVDGGSPVDLQTPRYAIFAPQQTVDLPANNILELPGPQTITFTPYGWEAWLTKLPMGRHTIRAETLFSDGSEPHITTHVIKVVGRRNGDHDD